MNGKVANPQNPFLGKAKTPMLKKKESVGTNPLYLRTVRRNENFM
jgi:hypothetical protein